MKNIMLSKIILFQPGSPRLVCLGLAAFYRRFGLGFAKIPCPLNSLLSVKSADKKLKSKVEWTAECQEAFEK